MGSAGAICHPVNHAPNPLPYTRTVGIHCFVNYILTRIIHDCFLTIARGVVLAVAALFVIRAITAKKPLPGFEDVA